MCPPWLWRSVLPSSWSTCLSHRPPAFHLIRFLIVPWQLSVLSKTISDPLPLHLTSTFSISPTWCSSNAINDWMKMLWVPPQTLFRVCQWLVNSLPRRGYHSFLHLLVSEFYSSSVNPSFPALPLWQPSSLSVVHRPTVSTLPGDLLEMQTSDPSPDLNGKLWGWAMTSEFSPGDSDKCCSVRKIDYWQVAPNPSQRPASSHMKFLLSNY